MGCAIFCVCVCLRSEGYLDVVLVFLCVFLCGFWYPGGGLWVVLGWFGGCLCCVVCCVVLCGGLCGFERCLVGCVWGVV